MVCTSPTFNIPSQLPCPPYHPGGAPHFPVQIFSAKGGDMFRSGAHAVYLWLVNLQGRVHDVRPRACGLASECCRGAFKQAIRRQVMIPHDRTVQRHIVRVSWEVLKVDLRSTSRASRERATIIIYEPFLILFDYRLTRCIFKRHQAT